MNMINIDPFLSLFDHISILLWPRKAMTSKTKGQVLVSSKEELLKLIEEANALDCFLASHRTEDKARGFLYIVFIDIDFENDLSKARRITNRILHYLKIKYEIKRPYVQFSGSKGYHIIIPIEPILAPRDLASDFLKFMQLRLSMGYCDPQLLGDIVRLIRIPNTYNSKALARGEDGLVRIIQEWDGVRFDVGILKEEYELKKLEEEPEEEKTKKHFIKMPSVRPQIKVLIERARQGINLTHRQRLAILFELINNGYSDEEILDIFKNLPDFDEKKTLYFIQHARKKGYKPFRAENIIKILNER
jgi:hypothetical protein